MIVMAEVVFELFSGEEKDLVAYFIIHGRFNPDELIRIINKKGKSLIVVEIIKDLAALSNYSKKNINFGMILGLLFNALVDYAQRTRSLPITVSSREFMHEYILFMHRILPR